MLKYIGLSERGKKYLDKYKAETCPGLYRWSSDTDEFDLYGYLLKDENILDFYVYEKEQFTFWNDTPIIFTCLVTSSGALVEESWWSNEEADHIANACGHNKD